MKLNSVKVSGDLIKLLACTGVFVVIWIIVFNFLQENYRFNFYENRVKVFDTYLFILVLPYVFSLFTIKSLRENPYFVSLILIIISGIILLIYNPVFEYYLGGCPETGTICDDIGYGDSKLYLLSFFILFYGGIFWLIGFFYYLIRKTLYRNRFILMLTPLLPFLFMSVKDLL